MEIRFGYKASNEQFGPTELLDYSVLAEECGFDSVFVSDHLQPWRHDGGHAPFAMSWLGALGARTSRVTIGTSVLTPTFRYHPAIVAQAFATLGCLYPGRVGDGYITTSGKGEELYRDTLLPAVREGAEKAERSVDDLDLMIEVKVSFDHDRDAAMHATRFWGALGLSAEQKSGVEDPVEMQRLADELSVEQTAKRFIVSTDPDEHVEKIKTYLDLGFTHLVFHAPGPDQAKFLRLYGKEILPRLRSL